MGGGAAVRTVSTKAAALGGCRAAHEPWARGWEADEWELAGGEEEARFEGLHTAPPTLDEAKEAASDLKDALRGLYSPRTYTGFTRSTIESISSSSESPCLEDLKYSKKGCAAVLPSAPGHVIQPFSLPPSSPKHIVHAFSLLQESPEVQDIVASLAFDIKVWNAILKNPKVLEFCKTHKIYDQPVGDSECAEEESDNGSGKEEGCPFDEGSLQCSRNGLRDFMHTIKLKVTEMVRSLSDLFETFMGATEAAGTGSTTIVRTSTDDRSHEDVAMGASFVALTIATIILIILKREMTKGI